MAGDDAVPRVPGAFGLDTHHNGVPEARPFGEEIFAPESREIPDRFHGTWRAELGSPQAHQVAAATSTSGGAGNR